MTALDLFCGGGAVCEGLQRLGYEVTGVDINQKCGDYYPGFFVHADATTVTAEAMAKYDLVWASPPCQLFSVASSRANRLANHHDLITPLRKPLLDSDTEWIIENVPHAPMRPDVRVNGPLVGLHRIVRERWFDVSRIPRGWVQPILTRPSRERWEAGEICVISKNMSNKATSTRASAADCPAGSRSPKLWR